jgi:hypothetical protein
VPAIVENTTPNQSAPTAEALVKAWLVGALDRAIEPLLCEVGCAGLTAEVIARRFRVAKGSARLTREAVDEAVWRTLDEWERQLPARADGVRDEPMADVCRALLAPAGGTGVERAAFTCCLGASPCPNGWVERWRRIAVAYGPGSGEIAQLLGEAIQAVASSDQI